jgi:hypothetical protein
MPFTKDGLRFDEYGDFNIINISDDEEVREIRKKNLDEVGAEAFVATHPEYYCCDENATALAGRLAQYGENKKLPYSLRNLQLAYREVLAEGKIKAAPPAAAPAEVDSRGIIKVREDALMVYETPAAEAAALEKVVDDPNLSDHARKARDRRLATLAGQQRRENSTLPRNYGQRLVL